MTLTTASIDRIRALRAKGLTYQAISIRLNVGVSTAWKYARDVPCYYCRRGPRPVSGTKLSRMRRMCDNGQSAVTIGKLMDLSDETVRKYCRDIFTERRRRQMSRPMKWRKCPDEIPTLDMPVIVTIRYINKHFPTLNRTSVYAGHYHTAKTDPKSEAYWEITGYEQANESGYIHKDGGHARIIGWMPGYEPYNENDD